MSEVAGGGSPLNTGSARRASLTAAGHRLAALQAGEPGDPPVLLVPGFTGSKENFGPVLDALAAGGWFVTVIDLPGQFESPPLASADYSPDSLAAIVRALAASLGPSVRLVGHSYGGLVARAAVIAAPDQFASLVLYSSGPAAIGGMRLAKIHEMTPLLATGGVNAVWAATIADPGYARGSDALEAFLARRFLAGSPGMYAGMGEALRTEPDRVDDLAATGLPLLVVHGEHDNAWPPAEQADMATRLGARHVVIPDAVHSAALENPPALAGALLDFWAR